MFVKYNLPISSIEMAKKLLYEAKVAVVPGSGFGKNGEGYLRISFGGYEKDILEATERIKKWIKNHLKII
jgi:aminotransferase